MSIEAGLLKKIVEGALMAANNPLSVKQLIALFSPHDSGELDLDSEELEVPTKEEVLATLEDIQTDCAGRGFELKEVGSGWRFQVVEETARWVGRLWEEKPQRYTRALLETLALIAYRQPITRGDIESIRGVAVSSNIIKTLTEREWVKVVGHRDVPGRPALYATTREFLDYFNLKSLDELPSLKEIQDLDSLGDELDFGADPEAAGEEVQAEVAQSSAQVDSELPAEGDNGVDSSAETESGSDGPRAENVSPLFPAGKEASGQETNTPETEDQETDTKNTLGESLASEHGAEDTESESYGDNSEAETEQQY